MEMKERHLRLLEAESIFVLREAAALFERPVLLYSIGKDSSVLLHLARKAFYPESIPFPLLHVDTTWKFREMVEFRDKTARELNLKLIVHTNWKAVQEGVNPFTWGTRYTDIMKTQALREALDNGRFDAAIGGARRDEEASRAKERIFSVRTNHRWNPREQRPELWRLFNSKLAPGQSMRIFPLSNWTERDVWRYIKLENIPVVSLYFSAPRRVVLRSGRWIMLDDDRFILGEAEAVEVRPIRFRTLGCYPLTGGMASTAHTTADIIAELEAGGASERHSRLIDFDQTSSMEKKKREGYF
jgi:sulfate adenylyltransferase subunit 2